MIGKPILVYVITHKITGRMYVGSSKNINRRIQSHLDLLRRGKHSVEDMQKDFDMYGENYTVEIVGVKTWTGRDLEYETMDKYNSRVRGVGYNYKDNHGLPKRRGYYLVKLLMTQQGVSYDDIANAIGYSTGTTYHKICGRYPLTLNEARVIRDIVAPHLSIEVLFEEAS